MSFLVSPEAHGSKLERVSASLGPLRTPPQTPRKSQHYAIGGLKGDPSLGPIEDTPSNPLGNHSTMLSGGLRGTLHWAQLRTPPQIPSEITALCYRGV